DAGDNTDAPEWDQRGPGFPRIVNGTIDIGAFEVQATGAPGTGADLSGVAAPRAEVIVAAAGAPVARVVPTAQRSPQDAGSEPLAVPLVRIAAPRHDPDTLLSAGLGDALAASLMLIFDTMKLQLISPSRVRV